MPVPPGTVSPEAIVRFDTALAEALQSWERLDLQHRIMLAIVDTILSILPSWLQLGPIAQFLDAARFLDLQYLKIGDSLAWLEQLKTWRAEGLATFRPSQRFPGDIDVAIDPDVIPELPEAFSESLQSLGGAQLWAALGVIAGIGGLKITTDYLAMQEATQQKKIEFMMLQKITDARAAGTLTEGEAIELSQLMREWKSAAKPVPTTGEEIITILTWGVGIALGLAGLNLVLRGVESWRARD